MTVVQFFVVKIYPDAPIAGSRGHAGEDNAMQIDGVGKGVAAGTDLANKSREKGAARAESPRDQGDQVSLHGRPRWAQALVQQALQFSLEINGGHYQAPKQTEEVTPDTLLVMTPIS
ncbi:hypothetical protein WL1483_2787 [Aeromonas schubertii]|uniref:Uncharacterized protein n=1 Tax=Aeromonas schubertii TaxID=652 RepID=A0A0S2SKV4_9GAMM|nr:hypothetical protein WL1483_2787 [Aeromonas schubertii]